MVRTYLNSLQHLVLIVGLALAGTSSSARAAEKPLPAVEVVWGEPLPAAAGEVRIDLQVRSIRPAQGIRVEVQAAGGLVPTRPLPRYEGLVAIGTTRHLEVLAPVGRQGGEGLLAVVEVESPAGTYRVGSFLDLGPPGAREPEAHGARTVSTPQGTLLLYPARGEPRMAVSSGAYNASIQCSYRDRQLGPGGFLNDDADDPLRPVRFADVVIMESDLVRVMGHTDANGAFSFPLDGLEGQPLAVSVRTSTGTWNGFPVCVRQTGTSSLYAMGGEAVFFADDVVEFVAEPGGGGEAFNVFDASIDALEYLTGLMGGVPTESLTLFWSPTSRTGTYFSRGASQIQLLADDGYDDPVIIHEVGHYVSWFHSADHSPGGIHYIDDANQDIRLAWSEGWASAFQMAVRRDRGDPYPSWYIDTLGQPGPGGLFFSYECEGPSLYLRGAASEVVVQAALWDILDDAMTPGDPGPGMDDDLLALPMSRIWNVLTGPMLTASSVSLEDFWDGWFDPATGYAHGEEITGAFGALGVEIFPDPNEPDNIFPTAKPLSLDGTPVHHSFGSVGDIDYHSLVLAEGDSVTVETTNIVGLGDTRLMILRPDRSEMAANDDRDANDFSSFVTFAADASGTWLVQVDRSHEDQLSQFASYGSYDIRAVAGSPRSVMLERTSTSTGVRNGGFGIGAAIADYDDDGYPDIYLVNNPGAGTAYGTDVLYRNRMNLLFQDESTAAGLGFTDGGIGAAWGDYDNDGDLDLFVSDHALYRNEGDGTFSDVSETSGVLDIGREFDASWVDSDRDGHLDLFVVRRDGPSALWRNEGNGTFTDRAGEAGFGFSADGDDAYGCAWGDYDGDGWSDLFLARRSRAAHALFRNLGGNRFEEVTGPAGLASMVEAAGGTWGDVDGDGDLDLYVAVRGPDRLYLNQGNGTFVDEAARWGIATSDYTQAGAFADVDLDGDLDLYVSNLSGPNALYENLGGRMIRNGEGADPGQGRGCAWADLDGDGDCELYLARGCELSCQANVLYENLTNRAGQPPRPWLGVRTVGSASNRDGVGARVRVFAGSTVQFREVGTGVGWASKSRVPELFGFADGATVDSVVVEWPAGGRTVVSSPAPYEVLDVVEESLVPVLPPGKLLPVRVSAAFPNPFASAVTVGFSLGEAGPVRIAVYDLQGRPVRRLLDRVLEAGDHVAGWDGEDDLGRSLPPGMYFYRLEAGSTVIVRKLVRF